MGLLKSEEDEQDEKVGAKYAIFDILLVLVPVLIAALAAVLVQSRQLTAQIYVSWAEAPASVAEFDHQNHPDVCGLRFMSVEEWEAEKAWERKDPVIVSNVSSQWLALKHWEKVEFLDRYGDLVVNMGVPKDIAQVGPGRYEYRAVTLDEYVLEHMHTSENYVFDRQTKLPQKLMQDFQPLPLPSRRLDLYRVLGWSQHITLSVGADQHGVAWHRHGSAWNTVVFGAKRWLLWNKERFLQNATRLRFMGRDPAKVKMGQPSSVEWLRTLYHGERLEEIRAHGHDCIQRQGDLMFVPEDWQHMVVNIGDTLAIVSEATHSEKLVSRP